VFFSTLGIPLRAGRAFTGQDRDVSNVAMVNETLASRLWPGRHPIGQRLWTQGTAYEVVGVVADYKHTAFQNRDWDPKLYLPLAEAKPDGSRTQFLIRATGDPAAVARALRGEITNAAPGNVVTSAYTLDEIIAVAGQEILVGSPPLLPLIATGMLLTAAGIYGVLAFAVTRRSREFAVRMAVGATGADLLRLVTSQSAVVVGLGTVCGVGASFLLARAGRVVGAGGSLFDPEWPACVVPTAIIIVAGVLATWVPSRRALKINPATLLRTT
jgi:predicted lysophospholipase L1 biosynthesis ABC-type transport system permease subunit